MMSYQSVIDFWFDEIEPASWWRKNAEFDELIRQRFLGVHTAANAGELSCWREQSLGCLAEILVLDQFSRNIYRDDPRSFASDTVALVLAQEMVRSGRDRDIYPVMRAFVYMPFMHSESAKIHDQALLLFDQPGMESNLDFEHKHKIIIDRFGRYPHRNEILGRHSTSDELDFLLQPGSAF